MRPLDDELETSERVERPRFEGRGLERKLQRACNTAFLTAESRRKRDRERGERTLKRLEQRRVEETDVEMRDGGQMVSLRVSGAVS